jgi:hypothetical protein
MKSLGLRIKEHWLSQNRYLVTRGVNEKEILSFESKYSVKMPLDLRDYFHQVNGMGYWPADQDKEGFSFYRLRDIKTLSETAKDQQFDWLKNLPEADSFFIFSDYLVWCWGYAVRLSKDPTVKNDVVLLCCHNPIKIADSFMEFVELYFEDDERLYPPKEHIHL